MKIIATTTLLLIAAIAAAQVTTETEYNYIKKGLQTTFEQGLDIKRGYALENVTTDQKRPNSTITAKNVIRIADSTIAGTFIKITVTGTFSGNGTFYLCMPAPNQENKESFGWNDFANDMAALGNTGKQTLLEWMAYAYSYQQSRANRLWKLSAKTVRAN